MRKMKLFSKRAGAMFLSVTMLSTAIFPEMLVSAAPTDESDYAATPEEDRQIVTNKEGETRKWNIVWSDEFNDGSLDDTKWEHMVGTGEGYSGNGWGNNEEEYYTDGENTAFVTEDNAKCLEITAKKNNDSSAYSGKKYTSSRLWTMAETDDTPGGEKEVKFAKTYGRIESRIKITGNKAGLWPAFWMMPANDEYGAWAASGELDIMEARGSNTNSVDGTLHYGSIWPGNKSIGGSLNKSTAIPGSEAPDFSTEEWHTYAVEWLPGEICWYVDDNLYYKTSNWYATSSDNGTDYTYPAPFDQDFYILLNLAVGGSYDGGALDNTLDNAKMFVDYVRVYDLVDEDGKVGQYDESNVTKPEDKADDELVSGVVNETNYVDSLLSEIRKTTGYPSEKDRSDWFISELVGGAATPTVSDDEELTVDVTASGDANYSVQLIHNVPLTKGYRYVLTFDGKAEEDKTLTAKFGNIGGYPAYSDVYNVDLTTTWQNYSYVFDMAADTDADGRIEFNFEQKIGKCFFRNFEVKCVGLTPKEQEDDAKEPLSNGNHVYNGTFDQGTGRVYYWHADNAEMSVNKAERKLNVSGTAADASVYQCGMNLLQSDSYKLTFDAKAAKTTDIKVKLTNKAGTTVYAEETVSLTTEEETHTVTFTMNEPADEEAVIRFVIGENTVTMDNVKMIRTTSNNIDWSNVDVNPMYNGDFYNGNSGWNIWSEGKGGISYAVENGVLKGDITIGEGADFWCVGMQSSAVKCKAGIPYIITLDMTLAQDWTIKVETPDGTQTDYEYSKDRTKLEIPFTPKSDCKGSVSLYWGLTTAAAKNFEIREIGVKIDTSAIAIPEGYAVPASVTSADPVTAGTAVTINHTDNAWASKVSAVYVNEQAIDMSKVDKTQNGKIVIDGSVFPAEGSYSVRFDAEGYVSTKAITQKTLPADGNRLVNSNFNTSLEGWVGVFSNWAQPNIGSVDAKDGEAVITVNGSEGNNWDHQLKQTNVRTIEAGSYLFKFDAYSDVERPIQLEFNGLGTPDKAVIDLTTDKTTYYVKVSGVPVSRTNHIMFMMGNVNGFLSDFSKVGTHNVYIDNVSFKPATTAELEASIVPTVTLSGAATVGQNMTFSYTENATWEGKNLVVTVNGNALPQAFVAKDTEANTITIDGNAVPEAGNYTFGFIAEGYTEAKATVTALAAGDTELFKTGNWSTNGDGGGGSVSVVDDAISVAFIETVKVTYDNGSTYHPSYWALQAWKDGIQTLDGKTYTLTFDANLVWEDSSVTDTRDIMIGYPKTGGGGGADGNEKHEQVTLSAGENKNVSLEITPNASNNTKINFMLGGTTLDKTIPAHTLSISNIRLEMKDATGGVGVTGTPLNTPANVKAVKNEDSIDITWDTVDGAKSYVVYRSLNGKAFGAIAKVTETSYSDSDISSGAYTYKIIAVPADSDTDHANSAASKATTEITVANPLPAPERVQTEVNKRRVTISWNKVNNAASYKVFRSADGTNFTEVAANVTKTSYIDTVTTAGTYQYKVRAIGNGGLYLDSADSEAAETTVASYVDAKAPVINKQPAGTQTYLVGEKAAALEVEATSADGGKITYQWYVSDTKSTDDGNMIAGATSAAYEPSTAVAGTKYYYCVIKNTNTSATGSKVIKLASDMAAVVVNENSVTSENAETPSITVQPLGKTYTVDDAVTALAVAATVADGGSLSYQWYKNTANSTTGASEIAGATSASYTPSTATAGTTYYFCRVTNTNKNVSGNKTAVKDSNIAAIVVNEKAATPDDNKPVTPPTDDKPVAKVNAKAPTISKDLANKKPGYKTTANLTVTAASADGGTLTYQWYKNTKSSVTGATAIKNATKASYKVPTTKLGTTYYFCTVTNTNSKTTGEKTASINSKVAKITVVKAANPITKVSKYSKAIGSKLTLKPAGKATYSVNKAGKKVVTVTKKGKVTFKNFGTATITVKAKGNKYYKAATKKIKFTVTPKTASVSSVKSTKSKTATVKWKKDTNATGYQIQYSTSSNFKGAKSTTVKKNSTTTTTLKKLKAGKKYYIRVREYKKVGKQTIYGSWSKAKTVKVKK